MICKYCKQDAIQFDFPPGLNLKKCYTCANHPVQVVFYFSDKHEYCAFIHKTEEMDYVLYLNYEINTTRFETDGKKLILANQNQRHFNINYTLNISPEEFLIRIPTWLLFS